MTSVPADLKEKLEQVDTKLFEIALHQEDDRVALTAIRLIHDRWPKEEEDPQNRIFQDLWLEPDDN